MVVLLQTTMSVAGEREQDTLVFLLLIPEDRRRILFTKWLGPLWRNWPVLAIAYLGALIGLAGGVYRPPTALALLLFPWPMLLMLTLVALWLSVLCRRVLFANMAVVGLLVGLIVAHIAAAPYLMPGLAFDLALLTGKPLSTFTDVSWSYACCVGLGEQAIFLSLALVAGILAWRRFLVTG
jgi:ABC-type transport system involved in multi-copper enzyme maturation permease subunit